MALRSAVAIIHKWQLELNAAFGVIRKPIIDKLSEFQHLNRGKSVAPRKGCKHESQTVQASISQKLASAQGC